MKFVATSITIFYDGKEDRLSLVFTDSDEKILKGLVTRRLFKGILTRLPDWLAQEHANPHDRTKEQQRTIERFNHQISQKNVPIEYGNSKPDSKIESFLVRAINFSMLNTSEGKKIRLIFQSADKANEIILALTSGQLHKLIAEILKLARDWDMNNPWDGSNIVFTNDGIKH